MEKIMITTNSLRKTSRIAGVLYLLTFVSIPTLSLYSILRESKYILGQGSDNNILIGVLLEMIVALAGIGTAVALFPVLKKYGEGVAVGLVGARILEASTIFAGVAFLLAVVSLKQNGAGQEALTNGDTLVYLYDRMFLIGQSFMPAIDDMLLGYLLYKSRLVPQGLSLIGIIGAPVLIAGFLCVLLGFIGMNDPLRGLFAIPVAVFEFTLGIYLCLKGFKMPSVKSLST